MAALSVLTKSVQRLDQTQSDPRNNYKDKVNAVVSSWVDLSHVLRESSNAGGNIEVRAIVSKVCTLHRSTVLLVLNGDWSKESGSSKTHLKTQVSHCADRLVNVDGIMASQCRSLVELLENPWGNATLNSIIKGEQCEDIKAHEFLQLDQHNLKMRLQTLCESKCLDFAQRLAEIIWQVNRLPENFPLDFIPRNDIELMLDMYIVLLVKLSKHKEAINRVKQLPLREGLDLVIRLKNYQSNPPDSAKIWKNCRKTAELVVQVLATRAMMQSPEENDSLLDDLLVEWVDLLCVLQDRFDELIEMINKIVGQVQSAAHIFSFCRALVRKLGDTKRLKCIELYIKGLTLDVNHLELLRAEEENYQAARNVEVRLSAGFLELATLLRDSVRMRRECVLTAFSLNPTPLCLEHVKEMAVLSGNCEVEVTDTGQGSHSVKSDPDSGRSDADRVGLLQDASRLGLPQGLSDDLEVVLSCPRYRVLHWQLDTEELLKQCEKYVQEMEQGERHLVKELKYLDIDYEKFKHLPKEDETHDGIEKGYEINDMESESQLEEDEAEFCYQNDFSSSPTTDAGSDCSFKVKKPKRSEPLDPRKKRTKIRKTAKRNYVGSSDDSRGHVDNSPGKRLKCQRKPKGRPPKCDSKRNGKSSVVEVKVSNHQGDFRSTSVIDNINSAHTNKLATNFSPYSKMSFPEDFQNIFKFDRGPRDPKQLSTLRKYRPNKKSSAMTHSDTNNLVNVDLNPTIVLKTDPCLERFAASGCQEPYHKYIKSLSRVVPGLDSHEMMAPVPQQSTVHVVHVTGGVSESSSQSNGKSANSSSQSASQNVQSSAQPVENIVTPKQCNNRTGTEEASVSSQIVSSTSVSATVVTPSSVVQSITIPLTLSTVQPSSSVPVLVSSLGAGVQRRDAQVSSVQQRTVASSQNWERGTSSNLPTTVSSRIKSSSTQTRPGAPPATLPQFQQAFGSAYSTHSGGSALKQALQGSRGRLTQASSLPGEPPSLLLQTISSDNVVRQELKLGSMMADKSARPKPPSAALGFGSQPLEVGFRTQPQSSGFGVQAQALQLPEQRQQVPHPEPQHQPPQQQPPQPQPPQPQDQQAAGFGAQTQPAEFGPRTQPVGFTPTSSSLTQVQELNKPGKALLVSAPSGILTSLPAPAVVPLPAPALSMVPTTAPALATTPSPAPTPTQCSVLTQTSSRTSSPSPSPTLVSTVASNTLVPSSSQVQQVQTPGLATLLSRAQPKMAAPLRGGTPLSSTTLLNSSATQISIAPQSSTAPPSSSATQLSIASLSSASALITALPLNASPPLSSATHLSVAPPVSTSILSTATPITTVTSLSTTTSLSTITPLSTATNQNMPLLKTVSATSVGSTVLPLPPLQITNFNSSDLHNDTQATSDEERGSQGLQHSPISTGVSANVSKRVRSRSTGQPITKVTKATQPHDSFSNTVPVNQSLIVESNARAQQVAAAAVAAAESVVTPNSVSRPLCLPTSGGTSLEAQLLEFESVLAQVSTTRQLKERQKTPSKTKVVVQTEAQTPTNSQTVSVQTHVNIPFTSVTKVSSTYTQATAALSPAASITSQSSISPSTTPGSSLPSTPSKSKPKTKVKMSGGHVMNPTMTSSAISKTQKTTDDEQTTLRILSILRKYDEELRCSPEVHNKPAPRRRNQGTGTGSGGKRKKGKSKTSSASDLSTDDMTLGSEDSSAASHFTETPQETHSPEEGEVPVSTSSSAVVSNSFQGLTSSAMAAAGLTTITSSSSPGHMPSPATTPSPAATTQSSRVPETTDTESVVSSDTKSYQNVMYLVPVSSGSQLPVVVSSGAQVLHAHNMQVPVVVRQIPAKHLSVGDAKTSGDVPVLVNVAGRSGSNQPLIFSTVQNIQQFLSSSTPNIVSGSQLRLPSTSGSTQVITSTLSAPALSVTTAKTVTTTATSVTSTATATVADSVVSTVMSDSPGFSQASTSTSNNSEHSVALNATLNFESSKVTPVTAIPLSNAAAKESDVSTANQNFVGVTVVPNTTSLAEPNRVPDAESSTVNNPNTVSSGEYALVAAANGSSIQTSIISPSNPVSTVISVAGSNSPVTTVSGAVVSPTLCSLSSPTTSPTRPNTLLGLQKLQQQQQQQQQQKIAAQLQQLRLKQQKEKEQQEQQKQLLRVQNVQQCLSQQQKQPQPQQPPPQPQQTSPTPPTQSEINVKPTPTTPRRTKPTTLKYLLQQAPQPLPPLQPSLPRPNSIQHSTLHPLTAVPSTQQVLLNANIQEVSVPSAHQQSAPQTPVLQNIQQNAAELTAIQQLSQRSSTLQSAFQPSLDTGDSAKKISSAVQQSVQQPVSKQTAQSSPVQLSVSSRLGAQHQNAEEVNTLPVSSEINSVLPSTQHPVQSLPPSSDPQLLAVKPNEERQIVAHTVGTPQAKERSQVQSSGSQQLANQRPAVVQQIGQQQGLRNPATVQAVLHQSAGPEAQRPLVTQNENHDSVTSLIMQIDVPPSSAPQAAVSQSARLETPLLRVPVTRSAVVESVVAQPAQPLNITQSNPSPCIQNLLATETSATQSTAQESFVQSSVVQNVFPPPTSLGSVAETSVSQESMQQLKSDPVQEANAGEGTVPLPVTVHSDNQSVKLSAERPKPPVTKQSIGKPSASKMLSENQAHLKKTTRTRHHPKQPVPKVLNKTGGMKQTLQKQSVFKQSVHKHLSSPKQGSPKQEIPKQVLNKQSLSNKQMLAKQLMSKQIPKSVPQKQGLPKQVSLKRALPKEVPSKQSSPKEGSLEQAVRKQTTIKHSVSKQPIQKQTTPKQITNKQEVKNQMISSKVELSKKAASKKFVPRQSEDSTANTQAPKRSHKKKPEKFEKPKSESCGEQSAGRAELLQHYDEIIMQVSRGIVEPKFEADYGQESFPVELAIAALCGEDTEADGLDGIVQGDLKSSGEITLLPADPADNNDFDWSEREQFSVIKGRLPSSVVAKTQSPFAGAIVNNAVNMVNTPPHSTKSLSKVPQIVRDVSVVKAAPKRKTSYSSGSSDESVRKVNDPAGASRPIHVTESRSSPPPNSQRGCSSPEPPDKKKKYPLLQSFLSSKSAATDCKLDSSMENGVQISEDVGHRAGSEERHLSLQRELSACIMNLKNIEGDTTCKPQHSAEQPLESFQDSSPHKIFALPKTECEESLVPKVESQEPLVPEVESQEPFMVKPETQGPFVPKLETQEPHSLAETVPAPVQHEECQAVKSEKEEEPVPESELKSEQEPNSQQLEQLIHQTPDQVVLQAPTLSPLKTALQSSPCSALASSCHLSVSPSVLHSALQSPPRLAQQSTVSTAVQSSPQSVLPSGAQTTLTCALQSPPQLALQSNLQSPLKSALQSALQSAPQSALQSALQSPPQSSLQSAVQSAPQSVLQSALQSTPQSALQSALQSMPQSALQSAVQCPPQSALHCPLQSTPQSPLQSALQSTPQSPLQSALQSTPQSPLQSALQSPPKSALQSAVQTPPQPAVQSSPQSSLESSLQSPPPPQSALQPALQSPPQSVPQSVHTCPKRAAALLAAHQAVQQAALQATQSSHQASTTTQLLPFQTVRPAKHSLCPQQTAESPPKLCSTGHAGKDASSQVKSPVVVDLAVRMPSLSTAQLKPNSATQSSPQKLRHVQQLSPQKVVPSTAQVKSNAGDDQNLSSFVTTWRLSASNDSTSQQEQVPTESLNRPESLDVCHQTSSGLMQESEQSSVSLCLALSEKQDPIPGQVLLEQQVSGLTHHSLDGEKPAFLQSALEGQDPDPALIQQVLGEQNSVFMQSSLEGQDSVTLESSLQGQCLVLVQSSLEGQDVVLSDSAVQELDRTLMQTCQKSELSQSSGDEQNAAVIHTSVEGQNSVCVHSSLEGQDSTLLRPPLQGSGLLNPSLQVQVQEQGEPLLQTALQDHQFVHQSLKDEALMNSSTENSGEALLLPIKEEPTMATVHSSQESCTMLVNTSFEDQEGVLAYTSVERQDGVLVRPSVEELHQTLSHPQQEEQDSDFVCEAVVEEKPTLSLLKQEGENTSVGSEPLSDVCLIDEMSATLEPTLPQGNVEHRELPYQMQEQLALQQEVEVHSQPGQSCVDGERQGVDQMLQSSTETSQLSLQQLLVRQVPQKMQETPAVVPLQAQFQNSQHSPMEVSHPQQLAAMLSVQETSTNSLSLSFSHSSSRLQLQMDQQTLQHAPTLMAHQSPVLSSKPHEGTQKDFPAEEPWEKEPLSSRPASDSEEEFWRSTLTSTMPREVCQPQPAEEPASNGAHMDVRSGTILPPANRKSAGKHLMRNDESVEKRKKLGRLNVTDDEMENELDHGGSMLKPVKRVTQSQAKKNMNRTEIFPRDSKSAKEEIAQAVGVPRRVSKRPHKPVTKFDEPQKVIKLNKPQLKGIVNKKK